MLIKPFVSKSLILLNLLVFISTVTSPVKCSVLRKLDETPTVPATGDPTGNCAPCTQYPPTSPSPPPPSPPPPPPLIYPSPPPPLIYPSPPPPSHKKPHHTKDCPPPPAPPSSFLYIMGPPGDLYPIDQNFNSAVHNTAMRLPVLVGCGLMVVMGLW